MSMSHDTRTQPLLCVRQHKVACIHTRPRGTPRHDFNGMAEVTPGWSSFSRSTPLGESAPHSPPPRGDEGMRARAHSTGGRL